MAFHSLRQTSRSPCLPCVTGCRLLAEIMASEMSAAEKMAQEHATSHQAYVEPAPEEPEPQTLPGSVADAPAPSWEGAPSSSKASGKQSKAPLDTKSHELFPELASSATATSKGKGTANAIPTWGAKAGGKENTNGSPRPIVQPAMTQPTRNVESITIDAAHMLQKKEMRRPIADIIKDINRRFHVKISMLSAANGRLKFDAIGPQDVAQQALKELVRNIGVKVSRPVSELGLVAISSILRHNADGIW